MSGWLDPLRSVLDASDEQVRFFFRDDDAGWDDDALERLLDVFEPHGPRWTSPRSPRPSTPRTVELLTARRSAGRNDVARAPARATRTSTTSRRAASASSA